MTILSNRNSGRADTLAERISVVAREHGQAQVARKTEFSTNNVSRYVNGTRAPLEFGTALVEDLGVNPAWLLTGQGTPYLSEVSHGTVEMAGDLLELVKAMAAVSHMRLGSLGGKHHLAVLRELNAALERFEELRAKLDKTSRGIFKDLLERVDKAFARNDMVAAEDLVKAASQVGRLCQDETLHTHLHACQAIMHYAAGRNAQGLDHQRRAFLNAMLDRAGFDDWVQMNGHNYCKMLMREHRMDEARRVLQAIMALSKLPAANLEVARATVEIELGGLTPALAALHAAMPLLDAPYNESQTMPQLARAQVLAGTLPISQAAHLGGGTPTKWARLLELAAALEDKAGIKTVLAMGVHGRNANLPADRPAVKTATAVLAAMEGRVTEVNAGVGDVARFQHLATGAQLARLAGKNAAARKLTREAGELIEALDAELTLPLESRVVHARNVLHLFEADHKEAACRKLRELAARDVSQWRSAGYHGLRGLDPAQAAH